ncbi:hypothetical protein [Bradyrhizobium sp. S3.9.1]|uniref:hypothetical protein n=1 Tax=Bradyrhizobium sp. S3.9.1 TaxID=3156431 RepID=UPI003399C21B
MVTVSTINRLSRAVEQIENWSHGRPWKVVKIRRGYHEDPAVARDRHYAIHPEDRDADVAIFEFVFDDELAEQSQNRDPPAGSEKS